MASEVVGADARPAQRVTQRESGGAAALGSPYGGAGERSASLRGRRQWQYGKSVEIAAGYPLSHGTFSGFATAPALSVTATPCQLSHRESQGAGVARPAHRNYNVV